MLDHFCWCDPSENPFGVIIDKLSALTPGGVPPDFSRILVIVPGRLWGRRLKDALVQRFPQGVCPPAILTPGGALHYGMEHLHGASAGEQLAVWEHVLTLLKESPAFRKVFPQRAGGACSDADCRNLAKLFFALRQELVQGGKTIADAAELLGENDHRWNALTKLESCFAADLKDFGLQDPFEVNRAYASAPAADKLTADFAHVIVAFVPDVPKLLEEKLNLLSERVTLLIHGSANDAGKFDAWGRPLAAWRETKLPVDGAHLHTVTNPEDAALLTLALATQNGARPFDPAQSAIVLGKPGFFPAFEAAFQKIHYENEEKPVALFAPDGVPGARLRIAGFLQKLSAVLRNADDFAAFHVLLRDEAFSGYLRTGFELSANQFLGALDKFALEALPDRTQPALDFLRVRNHPLAEILQKGSATVRALQDAADFAGELKKLLKAVFSRPGYPPTLGISFDDEVEYWEEALTAFQRSPVQRKLLPDAGRKLQYLLLDCENARFYPGRDNDAILVYNFLEFPALTQTELFLVGMNWGVEPAVRGTTPYLTDSIRKKLGLEDFESLAARESYKLNMLLRGKPGTQLLVLKYDESNTPLRPSGLLFQGCSDGELLQRAERCLNAEMPGVSKDAPHASSGFRLNWSDAANQPFFRKEPLEFSVTDFKTYLNSPRAFLLQKVFRVECPDYANGELDASDFGTACHSGFEALLDAGCTSKAEYARVLKEGADRYLYAKCGKPLPLVVELQRKQIHSRLDGAAEYLAQTHGTYRLLEAEYALNGGRGLVFGNALIKGKIDRIELAADNRTLRLIDVKTYNSAERHTPEKDHVKGKDLVNLQLPLYHRLLLLDEEFWSKHNLVKDLTKIEVGYLLLTADSDAAELKLWGSDAAAGGGFAVWSQAAEAKVQQVVAELQEFRRSGKLPPEPRSAEYFDLAPLMLGAEAENHSEEER